MSVSSSEPSSSSSSAVIPWGQSSMSAARLREQQVMFQVLDNPLLRDEIIKQAIIGGDKKVDQRSACILRLVDKTWKESVLRILWKAHVPLFQLVNRDVKNLDGFSETFAVSSAINGHPPPPLYLKCYPCIYRACCIEIFSNSLASCGPALVQLGINFFDFQDPLPVQLPAWSLPRLHKLDIILVLRRRKRLASGEQIGVRHEKIPENLVKSLLLGATALAELSFIVEEWSSGDPADVTIFEPIIVPPSLVKLHLEIKLNLQQTRDFVNAILKCPLPNVTSFFFTAWKDVFPNGLLFSILNKWKSSLKSLVILGVKYREPSRIVSTVRFPVMEQLEKFCMSSTSVELETGLGSLEKYFPKLHTLRLRHQTLRMLRKWTESSRFSGVTRLELISPDENAPVNDHVDNLLLRMSVSKEAMQLVNLAFPNLRRLGLGISKSDPSGLWYVFREMRELVTLNLRVFGKLCEKMTDEWDSILTGVPPKMMASIRGGSGPGSLEAEGSRVPITYLKELKSFSVKHDGLSSLEEDGNPGSIISDFIFDHAFLKMPQLKHLHFEGPFKLSPEMGERWMSVEGRSLVYQRFSNSDLYAGNHSIYHRIS